MLGITETVMREKARVEQKQTQTTSPQCQGMAPGYKTTAMILELNRNEENYYFPGLQALNYRGNGEVTLRGAGPLELVQMGRDHQGKAVAVRFYQLVSRHRRAQAALLSAVLV